MPQKAPNDDGDRNDRADPDRQTGVETRLEQRIQLGEINEIFGPHVCVLPLPVIYPSLDPFQDDTDHDGDCKREIKDVTERGVVTAERKPIGPQAYREHDGSLALHNRHFSPGKMHRRQTIARMKSTKT